VGNVPTQSVPLVTKVTLLFELLEDLVRFLHHCLGETTGSRFEKQEVEEISSQDSTDYCEVG